MLRCPGWSIPTHEGGERNRETAPTWRARRVGIGARRCRACRRDRIRCGRCDRCTHDGSCLRDPPAVEAPGQRAPAGHAGLLHLPGRRHQCRLYRLRPAQHQLHRAPSRGSVLSSCRAATPVTPSPCSNSSSPTKSAATAGSHSSAASMPRSTRRRRPGPRAAKTQSRRRVTSTPRPDPSSPRTTRRSGPTSPGCTTTATEAPTPTAPRRATSPVGATATASSGTGRQPARLRAPPKPR